MSQRGGGVGFCCGVPERVTCDYPGGVTGQEQRGWDESGLAGGAGTTGRAREKGRSGRRGTWALSGPAGLARWGPRGLGRPVSFSRPSPQRKKSRGWGQGGEQPVGWEVDGRLGWETRRITRAGPLCCGAPPHRVWGLRSLRKPWDSGPRFTQNRDWGLAL